MKTIFAILILFLISFSAAAQPSDLSALSKSESGKRVLAYFAAFNSGDEQKLRDFFTENIAAESLKQRPVEQRLEVHRQFAAICKRSKSKKFCSSATQKSSLLAQSKNGAWLALNFNFENQPPQKMLGHSESNRAERRRRCENQNMPRRPIAPNFYRPPKNS